MRSTLEDWQQTGMSASTRTVRCGLLDNSLAVKRTAKKPPLTKKNIKDWLECCRKYKDWLVEDWCKVIIFDKASFQFFGMSGKTSARRRKGKPFYESSAVPTVKHPKTIHVWSCFSSRGGGSLHFSQEHSHEWRMVSKSSPRASDPNNTGAFWRRYLHFPA